MTADRMTAEEKLLPQNIEAEAALLGCMLMDPDDILPYAYWLVPDMFYRFAHSEIYRAIHTLWRQGQERDWPVSLNILTLCDELERTGRLEEIGGADVVLPLFHNVVTSANWHYYAEIVQRTHVARQVIRAAGHIAALAYSGLDVQNLRRQVMSFIGDSLWTDMHSKVRTTREVVESLYAETMAVIEGAPSPLIPYGYRDIDHALAGGKPGELVVIAARTGFGKSALGLGMACHMVDYERKQAEAHEEYAAGSVLYVTLEMRAENQVSRLVSALGSVSSHAIRTGFVSKDGEVDEDSLARFQEAIARASAEYGDLLTFYDDCISVAELEQEVMRAVAEHNCKVLVVDQLDLFEANDQKGEIEYTLVSNAIKRLKQMARRLGILVLCLAQINREGAGVRPKLKHLRSSGRIEQDADVVMLIDRPYEDDPEASDDPNYPRLARLWLAKVRQGNRANQMIPLVWSGGTTSFEDWPPEWDLTQINSDLALVEMGAQSPTKANGKKKPEPARPRWNDPHDEGE